MPTHFNIYHAGALHWQAICGVDIHNYYTHDVSHPSALRALVVAKMVNVDPTTIMENWGMVFDENEQEIQDLANFPYEDLDGTEINIYNLEGTKIERRVPYYDSNIPPAAPLFRLGNITSMFDEFHHGDRTGRVNVAVYPQAFMSQYGQLQANTVLPEFHQVAQEINSKLLSHQMQAGTVRMTKTTRPKPLHLIVASLPLAKNWILMRLRTSFMISLLWSL
jgi:hypothetical protein